MTKDEFDLDEMQALEIPPIDEDGALDENASLASQPKPNKPVRIIALTGACGGAGTTTIAVQMAHELAVRAEKSRPRSDDRARPTVCILDLDFESGGLANAVDVPTALDVDDLARPENPIDDVFVSAVTRVHHSGFALIASGGEFGGNERVNPASVLRLLDILATQFDTVVLDIPATKTPWTLPAMIGADQRAVITPLCVSGLRRTAVRLKSFQALLGDDVKTDIILNKADRRTLRAGLNERDALKALQRPSLGSICMDFSLTNMAQNCGEPCGVIRSDARLVKDVRHLVDVWGEP